MNLDVTDMKQWVDRWRNVGPILEQLEKKALQAPDYQEGLVKLVPMLQWVCARAVPRETSGLVEQQRLFAKMRERMEREKS